MNALDPVRILLAATALSLAACGGGGGGGHVNSVPTPPPPPPPPQSAATVNIFPNPAPETYVSIGVGTNGSTADADQPHIRYTNGGYYEIQMPGGAYEQLITLKGFIPQYPDINNQFQPASAPQNQAFFFTSNSRLDGYRYSEMADWSSQNGSGIVAFGSATAPGAVPVAGSASYTGTVDGVSNILEPDPWGGGMVAVAVKGTVGLSFDFGAGTLAGSMTLSTDPYVNPANLGTFAFKNTIYSTGSATYSGSFDTSAAGSNSFLGRFTGPNAEETIGAWALPFLFSADGQNHQAIGAWIAKKGP